MGRRSRASRRRLGSAAPGGQAELDSATCCRCFPLRSSGSRLSEYDIVVTSSSAFAQGVRPGPGATHICYCHSPFRYIGSSASGRFRSARRRCGRCSAGSSTARPPGTSKALRAGDPLRRQLSDHAGADRADLRSRFCGSSTHRSRSMTGARERRRITCSSSAKLVRHKRVDVAIEAALLAGRPIRIVGDGPEREALEARFEGKPVGNSSAASPTPTSPRSTLGARR